MVLRIAPVFIGEQDVEEARIDVGTRCRQSPASLRCGVGPQQPSIAINDECGIGESLPARRGAKGDDPSYESETGKEGRCSKRERDLATSRATTSPPPLAGEGQGGGIQAMPVVICPLPTPPPQAGEGAGRVCRNRRASTRNARRRVALLSHSLVSSRRRHLDRTGAGAAETIRPVHVLHVSLRVHVAAG